MYKGLLPLFLFETMLSFDINNLSFWSYKMKLNWELCATRRELSQQTGWTIELDALYSVYT